MCLVVLRGADQVCHDSNFLSVVSRCSVCTPADQAYFDSIYIMASSVGSPTVRQEDEPLLQENPGRFVLFPIKYPSIWEMYKKHQASFWTGAWRVNPFVLSPNRI